MPKYLLFFILATSLFTACNDDITPPKQEEVHRNYGSGKCSINVTTDWITFADTKPFVDVEIKNEDSDTICEKVKLVVTTDTKEASTTISDSVIVPLSNTAKKRISFDATPGFYHCQVIVEDSVVFEKNLGYEPTKIIPENDIPDDFDAFWAATIAEVNEMPLHFELTPIDSLSSASHIVYRISFQSTPDLTSNGAPVVVGGYLTRPVGKGKFPATINPQGLGTGGEEPWNCDLEGFCRLELYARGQFFHFANPYTDWITFGIKNKDTYYYKKAVSDVLMGLRVLKSLDFVDADHLFAFGGSQGGALSIAAAAFDHSVKAIGVAIPFLGDYPISAKIVNWPAQYLIDTGMKQGLTQDETLQLLSYFDAKNWATRVTCPVVFEFSLQDYICPPRTTMAIYNNLIHAPYKSYKFNPLNQHSASGHFMSDCEALFRSCLK